MYSVFIKSVVIFFLALSQLLAAEESFDQTLLVNSYYGSYDVNQKQAGFPSQSLVGPKQENWISPSLSNKSYRIGILFPHMKDPYWQAVNYGLLNQAKKLNVGFKLLSAGGYDEVEIQKQQFKQLIKEKVDGIILASISYTALDELVAKTVNSGTPVVEVVNDIYSSEIQAKALVSFYEMGYQAAQFVANDSNKKQIKVGFFPGPKGSGWAPETLKGFFAVQRKYRGKLRVYPPKWGDTGYEVQRKLITEFIKNRPDIDYIVGNAIAAEVAVDILKKQGLSDKIKIVSTYIIPTIYEKVKTGDITAAPSDVTVALGKIAMDMMYRILNGEKAGEGFPFRAGPIIPVISQNNITQYRYEQLFGQQGFIPVFDFTP